MPRRTPQVGDELRKKTTVDGGSSSTGRSGLIRHVCVNAAHSPTGRFVPDGPGVLTIYQGAWAYCASALPDERHEWQETEGLTLEAIRHEINQAHSATR
jgi:hypothetical protein